MTGLSRATFTVGAAGAAMWAAAARSAAAAGPIRTGVSSEDGYEAWFALDTGLFSRAKLDVQSQMVQNGPAAAAAIIGGSLEIAAGNIVSVAQAHDRGLPVVLLAPSVLYVSAAANNGLVVLRDSPIRSAKDLEGKPIGSFSLQGILGLSTMAWIDKNGGDSKRVQFVEVSAPQTVAALQRGTIAAGIMVDPFLTAAGDQVRILARPEDALGSRLISTGWFTTSDWANQNAAAARAFAEAIADAALWANDPKNRQQATDIVAKYLGRRVDLGKQFYARSFGSDPMQPILDAAYHYAFVNHPVTLDQLVWR